MNQRNVTYTISSIWDWQEDDAVENVQYMKSYIWDWQGVAISQCSYNTDKLQHSLSQYALIMLKRSPDDTGIHYDLKSDHNHGI